MAKTVIGLYDSFAQAQAAVRDLVDNGFRREDISLIANDATREHSTMLSSSGEVEHHDASGAAKGAGIGAGIGGVTGLLVGLGALAIPGIGPIVAAGPLAAALAGAGIGAVAGGLIGALTDMGVPEEEAGYYAEGVRRGGTLVAVKTSDDLADRAADILGDHNPVDIDERAASWRSDNWTGFDHTAEAPTTDYVTTERGRYTAAGFGSASLDTHAAAGLDRTSDLDRTSGLDRSSGLDETRRTETTGLTGADRNERQERIPVVEEQMHIGKREVSRGGIRVHSHIEERPVEEQVRLREEDVHVERRPVNRPADAQDLNDAFRDRTIEMRETSEEPVVEKRPFVKEEIVVGKEVGERTETVRDTVRRTDVDVENTTGQNTGTGMGTGMATGLGTGTGMGTGTGLGTSSLRPFENYDNEFRRHHQSTFAPTGQPYDRYAPAYRHGYELASQERYRVNDWEAIEPEARRRWEERHRDEGGWEEFKDAVRHAWQKTKS